MQISVTHLTQMDRHQNDAHRSPVVHQQQNAQMAQEEATRRMNMPVEPDAIEKKNIDPDREKNDRNEKRKRRREQMHLQEPSPAAGPGGASLIDLQA